MKSALRLFPDFLRRMERSLERCWAVDSGRRLSDERGPCFRMAYFCTHWLRQQFGAGSIL